MVARGAEYRVRWSEQQVRPSLSLTDLVESAASSDEDSFDSLIDDPLMSSRYSQGDDNSSEGDRNSEMAADLPSGRTSGCGDSTSAKRHAYTRSTPALEEAAAAAHTGHHRLRVQSLTDLRGAFLYRSASPHTNAAAGGAAFPSESTRLVYKQHHRKRSQQRTATASNWITSETAQSAYSELQHFRKKSSTHRFDHRISTSRSSTRYSTQSNEWSVTAFTIPEDVPALLCAIEASDQQISRACHDKMRLLDEYRELHLRYQIESKQGAAADSSATPTGVPSRLQSLVNARTSATEKLVTNLRPLIATRQKDGETGDATIELTQSQVLDVMLALNSQVAKLLVCFRPILFLYSITIFIFFQLCVDESRSNEAALLNSKLNIRVLYCILYECIDRRELRAAAAAGGKRSGSVRAAVCRSTDGAG